MKILIAGGAGFIGSSLSLELLKRGESVVVNDNLNSSYSPRFKEENISELLLYPKFIFRKVDILHKEEFKKS